MKLIFIEYGNVEAMLGKEIFRLALEMKVMEETINNSHSSNLKSCFLEAHVKCTR